MFTKKFYLPFLSFVLVLSAIVSVSAQGGKSKSEKAHAKAQISEPMNLAILIQDDLVSRVGNELNVTKEFIRSLPDGSQVMVGYITSNSLQVRQKFTTDLEAAAKSLRVNIGRESASSYDPFNQVLEALKYFDKESKNQNAILLISDGLDVSEGLDSISILTSTDLERSIKRANEKNVNIYSFYAPSVSLSSRDRNLALLGQSALVKLSDKTGGKAFFQGTTSFVTFDSYFERLRKEIIQRNERIG
jgi:hypothetical protein